jgi:hypothetical protein
MRIESYRLIDGKYERGAELSLEHQDALTSPLFPGLSAPLAGIFALA